MAEPDLPPYAAAVRRHDPDRFLTALFAPPERRDALFLLYAFNHELARAREVASEPMLALIRLQWWREVVEGEPRRHELATPLSAALADGRLPRAELLEMIEGREMEAEPSIPTRAAWRAYIEKSAGALAMAAGRALGAVEPDLVRTRALGAAYGVAGLLRSVDIRAREGRCLLPEDVLGAHGLTLHDMIAAPERGGAVIAELAHEGLAWHGLGRGRYPSAIRSAALVGVFARRDLARIGTPSAGKRMFRDRLAVMAAATGWFARSA
jgi:phytoene synthase